MQLTNFSFLDARRDYLSSQTMLKTSMNRLATGKRLERSGTDAGAISQIAKANVEKITHRSYMNNLQNARSFVRAQEVGLFKVQEIYERMEQISLNSLAPTTTEKDREDYEIEFQSLVSELEDLMQKKFNGKLLFSDTLLCGGSKKIPLDELDLVSTSGKLGDGSTHAIRSQSASTGSPAGTIRLRVNSGTAGDIYRVWMGDVCVFSTGYSFMLDHTKQYNDNFLGDYNDGTAYSTNDLVQGSDGNYYLASYDSVGEDPASSLLVVDQEAKNSDFDVWRRNPTEPYEIGDMVRKNGEIWVNVTGNNPANNASFPGSDWVVPVWRKQDTNIELTQVTFQDSGSNQNVENPSDTGWRTSNSASVDDDDLFEISFAPGEETTYKITPGGTNDDGSNGEVAGDKISDYNDYANGKYTNITTLPLPAGFEDQTVTIQVESNTIGIIYDEDASSGTDETEDGVGTTGISFEPADFTRKVTTSSEGNYLELRAKGFGILDQESIVTGEMNSVLSFGTAQDLLDHLQGNNGYFGETKCVLNDRLSQVAAEYQRIDMEIAHLQNKVISDEFSIGRITDADIALEATDFAINNLKSELSSQAIIKSARLKDVLVPLTTSHFRGSLMGSSI